MNLLSELRNPKYYELALKSYIEKNRFISLEISVSELMNEITNNYNWSIPRLVKIPKSNGNYRDIIIFPEKDAYLLKVINAIFVENFSDRIESSVFSYKKGVRCFDAGKYIQNGIRNKSLIGMKIDISNYFQSVPLNVIMDSLKGLIDDRKGLELLNRLFSLNKVILDNQEREETLGLIPGSALSSFMANYILSNVDKNMSRRCEVYSRYSDDIVIFCENEEKLNNAFDFLKSELSLLGLTIKDEKVKYFNDTNVIDFLGLEITESYIDVNEETYHNTRKLIKRICTNYKKKGENKSNPYKLKLIERDIKKINRSLYSSMISDRLEHKGGRLQYIFSNITRQNKLKELDFYILDTLRYIYTGKYNKSAVKLLSTKTLERMGFRSLVQMYNVYKIDRDICVNEASILLNPFERNIFESPIGFVDNDKSFQYKKLNMSFSSFYGNMLSNNYKFVMNNMIIGPENITFDIEKGQIRILDEIIVKGNKIVKPFNVL